MKLVIKLEISQSTRTINFLDVCIILNQQTSYTTVFSKHTDAHIYLNPKSCHPEHMIRIIPKSQFLRLRKICPNTSDYIKKSNEYLNFFVKQGYDSTKLKMLVKDILANTCDELLPQNKKTSNLQKRLKLGIQPWNIYPKYFKKNIIALFNKISTLKKYSQRNQ